ncbi:MAG: response regulator transcription factor [Chloroflexi bacterium]|nr:response regulator transcription factor [Chloroflexota bacterium]
MAGERILVVDDEPRYLRAIRFNLEAEGYRITCVGTGDAALAILAGEGFPDLVILDIMLPGLDGFQVCARVREVSTVPIIMLTARGSDGDKVQGLRLGADDYVVKPFSAQELLARVDAVLRRARTAGTPEQPASLAVGDLHVDFLMQRVRVKDREVRLSPTEYRVLHCLASNAGRTVTQDDLLEKVWGAEYRGEHEVLRVTVWRLRQKLEEDPQHPRLIRTVSGAGYLLASLA